MKDKVRNTKKQSATITQASRGLLTRVRATEKIVEKAWATYEEKVALYEQFLKQHAEKTKLNRVLADAKIARLTYKIKKIEHKLVKSNWKLASKLDKKAESASLKETVKPKVKKASQEAPKDAATKGKSSAEANSSKAAKKGKKVVQAAK